jgi:DNA-binding CsgD family transcriptional regulator
MDREPTHDVRTAEFTVGDETFVLLSVPLRNERGVEPLTAAEREIAAMVVAGLANAEIAKARSKSVRTIANQVASIFRKLKVGSRVELSSVLALHRFEERSR